VTAPTYFTVIADYRSSLADTTDDVDADPDLGVITANVTFRPVIDAGDVILATGASPRPTGFVPAPIQGFIDTDGLLKLRATAFDTYSYTPIRLLADTDLLELDGPLFYTVTFTNVVYDGKLSTLKPFTFQAPNSDTVLNLIEVSRAPGQPASGITKIAPGGVRLADPTTIQFSFGGVDIDDPVSLAGLVGPTGATGATGSAATVTVGDVSTLAPGSPATVVNTGSTAAAVLEFGVPQGATGADATVAIGSVTTGAAGSTASVVNVGTSGAAVFNVTIPRGDRGEQGEQGVQGIQGVQGEAGVSLDINGTVATWADLPASPEPGEAWVVAADGRLYFYDGLAWPADGAGVPFVGPAGPQGVAGPQGLVGATGDPGQAATIAVGTVTGGATAAVNNSGDSSSAVFDFTLPIGPTGDAATIAVGTVTALDPGQTPTVTNSGTSGAAVFDFGVVTGSTGAQGATGDAATIAVGTVTTGDPGTSASVTNSGNSGAAVFDFTIPAGPTGAAATIAIGTVTTGDPGTEASATNVGTETDAVIDLVIPRGATGSASGETWETLAGKPAVVAAGATEADARAAIDAEYTGNKGVAGGYAELDGSGLVPQSQLPITTASWSTLDGKPAVVAAGATKADARTAIDAEYTGAKGQANGYASLDANGRVPLAQLTLTAVDGGTPATAVFVDAIDGGTP